MVMVLRANKNTNVGGHIASFASSATLYDVGYNHFWHAASETHGGDLVYVQGHVATGIYARAFMLGRLSEDQMDNFQHKRRATITDLLKARSLKICIDKNVKKVRLFLSLLREAGK